MLSTILLILIIFALITLVFGWPRRSSWGYGYNAIGLVGALLIILLILALLRVI